MLFTRITQRISAVQELCAERLGLLAARPDRRDDSINAGFVDVLKWGALAGCLGLALLAAVLPAVASSTLQQILAALGRAPQLEVQAQSLTQILQAAARDVNRNVPQQIDQITRLDRASVEGDQFVYEYTLNVERLSGDGLPNLYRHVRASAVPAFCGGQLKDLRGLKAVVVYRYSYPNGEHIGQVTVSERDCR
jgi:hypothetical protein